MDIVLGILCLFLIGIWVSTITNSRKTGKNERFIGYIQRYDIDGEGYQQEVWEVTDEEDS